MPGRPLSRPPASSAALWKASTAARAVTANATCRADSCGRPSAIQRADVSSAPNPPPPSDSSITLYPSGASACLKNFRLRDPSLTFKEMWSYMVASPFAHPARPALYCPAEGAILGKIAVAVEEALARRALEGAAGGTTSRSLAAGRGRPVGPDRGARAGSRVPGVRPLGELSDVVARGCAALPGSIDLSWEELVVRMAARAVRLSDGLAHGACPDSPAATARVTRV